MLLLPGVIWFAKMTPLGKATKVMNSLKDGQL